jgi:hypothetical protein
MRKNRSVRFDFCGSTVLLASRGDQVSFYTTVDVWGGAFEDHSKNGIASIVSMLLSGPRSKIN